MKPSGARSRWTVKPAIEAARAFHTGRNSIAWQPLSPQDGAKFSPQQLAIDSLADVLFYGGAAGGGKTDLEIGLSLKYHQRSIIFRRVGTQLTEIEERIKELVGDLGSYQSQKKIFRIYDGRKIELGSVEHAGDEENFQGRPHDLICFDELPHFLRTQFHFLTGWMRTTDPKQRKRIVCTGNPPTDEEGSWVIDYFGPWLDRHHPNPARAGELRWFAMIDGKDVQVPGPDPIAHKGEQIYPESRTFIPAKVRDNPYYWETGYAKKLQNMPEPLRSQLLYGDFTIAQTDNAWQVIPTAWIKAAQARWTPEAPGIMTSLGVDVARGGNAKTTLAPKHRNWFGLIVKIAGKDTPDGPAVAAEVVKVVVGHATIRIDVVAIGSSPYDHLKVIPRLRVVPMNGGAGSDATDKSGEFTFKNKRAEWHWKFREALDPVTGEDLALPPDRELLADLCAPRWFVRGKVIQVEDKLEIIKRLGRSPDCGDAVINAHAEEGGCIPEATTSSERPASGSDYFGGGSWREGF